MQILQETQNCFYNFIVTLSPSSDYVTISGNEAVYEVSDLPKQSDYLMVRLQYCDFSHFAFIKNVLMKLKAERIYASLFCRNYIGIF